MSDRHGVTSTVQDGRTLYAVTDRQEMRVVAYHPRALDAEAHAEQLNAEQEAPR